MKNPKRIVPIIFALLGLLIFFVFLIRSSSFPDLFALFYVPHWVGLGNIYSLVAENKSVCVWLDATYPPLYYLSIGNYLNTLLTLHILPTDLFTQNACPFSELLYNSDTLFWFKFPFLIFHFLSALIIYKLFNQNKLKWAFLWLTSPIIIFITFIESQFDIVPIFFVLLSFLYAKKNLPLYSAFYLGIGGALKHYPFLLMPIFIISLAKTWRQAFAMCFIAILPYAISVLPMLNTEFINRMLNFNENQKMLSAGFQIGDFKVSFYIIIYLFILGKQFFFKEKGYNSVLKSSFLIILAYFITTPTWFVQRLLFLMPALILTSGHLPRIKWFVPLVSVAFFVYALVYFPGLFDHTLFRPLFSSINTLELSSLLPRQSSLESLQALVYNGFTLIFIAMAFIVFRSSKFTESKISSSYVLLNILPLLFYFFILWQFIILSNSHL